MVIILMIDMCVRPRQVKSYVQDLVNGKLGLAPGFGTWVLQSPKSVLCLLP